MEHALKKPMWYVLALMAVGLGAEAWGFVLIKKGLIEGTADLPFLTSGHFGHVFAQITTTPRVLLGTALEALHFGILMELLSFGDVSFIIPITSIGYVLTPVTALVFLHETIPPIRWIGILFICTGVFVILRKDRP